MARKSRTPDVTWLRNAARRGLTQQQMVDRWEQESGIRVSRSAIGMAMKRNGVESATHRPRYADLLPWQVLEAHKYHRHARLLRLESRRRAGRPLTPRELQWLTTWLDELDMRMAVVTYDPQTEEGFHWVRREPRDQGDIVRQPDRS